MYRIVKRENLKQMMEAEEFSEKAEFCLDGELLVTDMLAYIYGEENNIIKLEDFLYMTELNDHNVHYFRFSRGEHVLIRDPRS